MPQKDHSCSLTNVAAWVVALASFASTAPTHIEPRMTGAISKMVAAPRGTEATSASIPAASTGIDQVLNTEEVHRDGPLDFTSCTRSRIRIGSD